MHRSARKHGVEDIDIVHAASTAVAVYRYDEEPPEELRLGFDTAGRLLEVIVLMLDHGREVAIHAMPARPQYLHLLPWSRLGRSGRKREERS